MKILLLTPVGYNHSPFYWISVLAFQKYCMENNILLEYSFNRISNIYYARENLLTKVSDHDYVLWVDSDCTFTPENVMQLIKHDKDCISGIAKFHDQKSDCMKWNFGVYLPQAYNKLGVWIAQHPVSEPLPQEPIKVDFVGCHFMLIKTACLKKLPVHKFEPLPVSLIHLDIPGYMSEDGAFCWIMNHNGVDVWVDPACKTGHHKDTVLK